MKPSSELESTNKEDTKPQKSIDRKKLIIWLGFIKNHFLEIGNPSPSSPALPTHILSDHHLGIYCGNFKTALNPTGLSETGITHIVNCALEIPCFWEAETLERMLEVAKKANLLFLFDVDNLVDADSRLDEMKRRCADIKYRAKYLHVPMVDRPSQEIGEPIDRVFEWIKGESGGAGRVNVMFHCHAGVSRSTAIMLGFMMRWFKWGRDESLQVVKRSYPRVNPNLGFLKQLDTLTTTSTTDKDES